MNNLSFCVACRAKTNSINESTTEKINPRTKRTIQIIKGQCVICNRNKSMNLTK